MEHEPLVAIPKPKTTTKQHGMYIYSAGWCLSWCNEIRTPWYPIEQTARKIEDITCQKCLDIHRKWQ